MVNNSFIKGFGAVAGVGLFVFGLHKLKSKKKVSNEKGSDDLAKEPDTGADIRNALRKKALEEASSKELASALGKKSKGKPKRKAVKKESE